MKNFDDNISTLGEFIADNIPLQLIVLLALRGRPFKTIMDQIFEAMEDHDCEHGANCTNFDLPDAAIFCRFHPDILEAYQRADTVDAWRMRNEAQVWRNYRSVQA